MSAVSDLVRRHHCVYVDAPENLKRRTPVHANSRASAYANRDQFGRPIQDYRNSRLRSCGKTKKTLNLEKRSSLPEECKKTPVAVGQREGGHGNIPNQGGAPP